MPRFPPPVALGPPLPLVVHEVPQHAPECRAQGDVSHFRARKKEGIGGVPAVRRPLRPGEGQHQALVGLAEAPGMVCPPPLQLGGRNQKPLPPWPLLLHCHVLDLGLHLLHVLRGLLLLNPPPPDASFFFVSSLFFSFFLFLSSFFFSFFLLFLSCSEESVDSSLEESAAGREAEAR